MLCCSLTSQLVHHPRGRLRGRRPLGSSQGTAVPLNSSNHSLRSGFTNPEQGLGFGAWNTLDRQPETGASTQHPEGPEQLPGPAKELSVPAPNIAGLH